MEKGAWLEKDHPSASEFREITDPLGFSHTTVSRFSSINIDLVGANSWLMREVRWE